MYNGTKVLDIHGHLTAPPELQAFAAFLMAANSPVRALDISDEKLEVSQQTHLKVIDDRSVDVQLIGPRPFAQFLWLSPHLQHVFARNMNNLIAQAVKLHPDRFLGMAHLPQSSQQDTSHVVPELERCVNELGFAGAYVDPDPGGRQQTPGMHEGYWFPLYEAAQRLDIPLMVHPTGTFDRRVEVIPHNYQIANVVEEYIATQLLSRTKTFEKFPSLRVIICHLGGSLDRWIKTDPHLSQQDLSNNLFFDSCAHDISFLDAGIKQRGVSQVLFGTEAPGSGSAPRPETGRPADDLVPVIAGLPDLTEDDKIEIFNGNAKRVFPRLRDF